MAPTDIISGDTSGLRMSEICHAVDYADANGDLDRLRVNVTHPETGSGERLEPIHRILSKRSPMVTTVFLPFSTTVTKICINHAVTLRYAGRICCPTSGTHTWRNRKNGISCSKGRMAWLGIVGTVSADDINLLVAPNLVEQLGQSVTAAAP
ncbi:MAG: hypothetical protein E5299_01244 [Burkholderia gladioli]|nr:MAG: hypothetical protein E5299_01244 [Burkholderia gladioli]